MTKIDPKAIKTLAKTIAKAKDGQGNDFAMPNSAEIIRLNRKLREALGVKAAPQKTPLPKAGSLDFGKTKTKDKKNKIYQSLDLVKIKNRVIGSEPEKKQNKETADQKEETAELVQKRKDAQRAAEQQKKQAEEEERLKKEEEAKKIEEERIKKEEERRQAEEKEKAEREEKQRKLAALEAERAKRAEEEKKRKQEEAKRLEEERLKKEEERRQEEQKKAGSDLQAVLKLLLEKLVAKNETLKKESAAIPARKEPLEQKRRMLESKISMIRNSELATIEEREREIEKKIAADMINLKQIANSDQEKLQKQRIWETEERRKEIEKQRWAVEDKIDKIAAEGKIIDAQVNQEDANIASLEKRMRQIADQIDLIDFVAQKNLFESKIIKIVKEKELFLPQLIAAENAKNEAEENLFDLVEKENSTAKQLEEIETKEALAKSPAEKRTTEQLRWQAGNDLKTIVEKKWSAEGILKKVSEQLKNLQKQRSDFDKKIDEIQDKITAMESDLAEKEISLQRPRETIRKLLEENKIYFVADILNDIIQTEENHKSDNPSFAKNEKTNQGEAPKEKIPAAEIKTALIQKNKEGNTAHAKETIPSIASAQDTKNTNNQTIPAAADKETTSQKTTPDDKSRPKKLTEKESAPTAETVGATIKQKEPQEFSSDRAVQKFKSVRLEDKKLSTQSSKNINLGSGDITSSQNGAVYREQVESSPAKNIRAFKENENFPMGPPSSQKIETAAKKEPPEDDSSNSPLTNPNDRWREIKKTTIPAATTKAVTAANNNIPAEDIQPVIEKSQTGGGNKMIARIIVILVLAGILAIILLLILSKGGDVAINKPGDSVKNTDNIPPEKESQAVETPKTILSTISPILIYADDSTGIPNLISPYLRKKFDAIGYYELSLINRATGKSIGLKEFFNAYKVSPPSVFYSAVKDDCEFFIYANNGKNRLGFACKIANADLVETAMSGWESSIAQNTESFFRLLGRKTALDDATLKFTENTAAGISYKVMNVSPPEEEFAIAWANYRKTYFIFSTSNNSMSKIFDRLPK